MPLGVAVLVDTLLIKSVLAEHWAHIGIESKDAGAKTLVLYLPKIYRDESVWVVTRQPDLFNAPQLNLRNNTTLAGWRVDLPGEAESTIIRLPVFGLHSVFSEAYRPLTHKWGWMPMMVVTGDMVVMGGFLVDESFVMGLQDAAVSAQGSVPESEYSTGELQVAHERASVHGLEPWIYKRWHEDGQWTVQLELFSFTK